MTVGKQSVGCLLQRGVVRDRLEAEFGGQLGHIGQQRDHAAIVLLLMRLEHQQSEQLMLSELLGTEPVRVRRERLLSDFKRFERHLPW